MTIKISEALKLQALSDTARIETPDEFNLVMQGAKAEISRLVREELEPNQAIDTTLTELRDVYLSTLLFEVPLAVSKYDKTRRIFFQNSVRLLEASNYWLKEENRAGTYRVRPITEVIEASRPWRARLSAVGGHAFIFDSVIADQFADVNSTGTLEEEKKDLEQLNALVKQHKDVLREYGLTDEMINEGTRLLNEVKGRDFFAILGLRDQEDATSLRNQLLSYAVQLGKEARAAGVNACYDDVEAKKRFEAKTFRNALRRLRPRRKNEEQNEPEPTTKTPTETK